MDKIIPINSGVLCRPLEDEKHKGIEIPDNLKKQPSRGVVVRVADGITAVSEGQGVAWKELAGTYLDDLILVDLFDILYTFDVAVPPLESTPSA